jgi:hypothetical protein
MTQIFGGNEWLNAFFGQKQSQFQPYDWFHALCGASAKV